jgi:hypothetical protein
MSDFDTMLRRPLRSGNEYDALFPITVCKSTYVGDGNTDFSIDEMEKVIDQYAFQTEKVARKLQKPTLKATTDNIHDFLFNHFQYLADESNQLLRSPACSWFTRKKGIDCKSYSILASCILLNLEITHYIRKIKQPGYAPDEFTHVYVVVPMDQETGSLESGYHVIDGTLQSNIEPALIGKSDTKMNGLPHYSLNGTFAQTQTMPLNGGVSFNDLKNLSKKLSLKDLNIFKGIGCLGWNGKENSAVNPAQYTANITSIENYYAAWQVRFNTAIQNKNYTEVSKLVAEYQANSSVFVIAVKRKVAERWNSCTTERMNGGLKVFTIYKDVIGKLLTAYMDEYFNKTSGTQSFNATSATSKVKYGFDWQDFGTPTTQTVSYSNVSSKNVNIPAFQVPQTVIDSINSGNPINVDNFLTIIETAGNIVSVFTNSGSSSDNPFPNGGSAVINPGVDQNINPNNQTSNAGMGWLVGGAVGIVGLAIVFGKMKDAPKKV